MTDEGLEHEGPQPGNSVHGQPTHHNRPVGSFFGKGEGRPRGKWGARPQQPGGPMQSGTAHRSGKQRPGAGMPRGAGGAAPYVTTTLTIPGAIPQGLPGTTGPKPKGPHPRRGKGGKGGKPGVRGPGSAPGPFTPPAGQGSGNPNAAGKRPRGNRQRRGPKPGGENPGNEAQASAVPAVIDDDIGNR